MTDLTYVLVSFIEQHTYVFQILVTFIVCGATLAGWFVREKLIRHKRTH